SGEPTPAQRTTRDAFTGAERALRKLTHAYLQAVSTPDSTHRDQARAILATARRDLRTILTPEA
ncbi:hypothetical protein, partial [Catenulispora pinisilvae]|uniref:hypothetical protein n=1 Tax=Catenulispora pinisilvae TaxID=2705253 RepID=UPI00189234F9